MPRTLQTMAGFFTAAGAGTNPATPAPGDSFAVASFTNGRAYLENVSASGATTDFVRMRSPRLHDANQGLRLFTGATKQRNLLPWGMNETLYSSDVPTVEIDATAAGSGGILLTYGYDDLNGGNPRLDVWPSIQPRIVHVSGVEVDVTSGAIGAWGNSAPINGLFDNFEAGADYAWLGWMCNAPCLGIALTGKDTSNFKVGGPGDGDPIKTREYWINASSETGRPFIPIIAANNKAGTILQNVDSAAGTVVKVTLILAQLA